MLILLAGFILGITTVILIQYFTLSWVFLFSPKYRPQRPPPYCPPSLPPDLSHRSSGPFREETSQWVNFCGAFLFQELRESNLVKKAVITKLNEEFKEFLLKKTTGQLLHQVTVRDYFLGNSLPQVNSVQVLKVKRDEKEELLTEVSVGFDFNYKGGAIIAIDADILMGKSASISVELVRLQGKVRLHFSREPYTHWSIAFMRDPLVEVRIAPEFQGRNVSQLTVPIEKLIQRFIRKKHTLPYYKVRRSPLFPKLVPQSSNVQIYMHDTALIEGILELDILSCSRLLEIPEAKRAFCTAAITNKPWKPLNRLVSPTNGPMHNLTVERGQGGEHGASFQRYQDPEMEINCIVVSEVTTGSAAAIAGVMKGDFVFFVNGVEVKTVSKAKSLIDTSTSGSFILTVQRFFASHIPSTGQVPIGTLDQPTGAPKPVAETDPEIASLLGGYTPVTDPPAWEERERERERQATLCSEKDIQTDKESAARGFPEDFPNAEYFRPDQQQRTKYNYYSRHIPAFPDRFTFNIMPEHKYLSIALWYDSPDISDAALAGHVTIPLSDIAVECIATSSGRHTERYVLVPVNPLRPGMSKIHARQIAAANDSVSKPWIAAGVANKHAQFAGDILLCFSHTPRSLRREDTPEYAPWSRHIALSRARQRERERGTDGTGIQEEVRAKNRSSVAPSIFEEFDSSYDALIPEEDTHNFLALAISQSEHDICKLCYRELGPDLVSRCQHCGLICHQKCALLPNTHLKIVCNERTNKQKTARTHTPLCTRLSVNVIEANAEKVLMSTPPLSGQESDIVPDTTRFQDKPLRERLVCYREHISMLKNNMDTHEEVVISLKLQLSLQTQFESKQVIKSQLNKTEDKQRAIATLLLQYCQGLKILETTPDSGSERDD